MIRERVKLWLGKLSPVTRRRLVWWVAFSRHFTNLIDYYWADPFRLGFIIWRSKVMKKPVIRVIGDSHVRVFKNISLCVAVHHIGAATAHNLCQKNSTTDSNAKLFKIIAKSSQSDVLALVFGEIDCRIHIYYQYMKHQKRVTMSELIDRTIVNYGSVLEKLNEAGLNFIVCSVPPAGWESNAYDYPYYAPRETRGMITMEYNQKLRLFCEQRAYQFLDICSAFCDENGFTRDEYAADATHLNKKATRLIADRFSEEFAIKIRPFSLAICRDGGARITAGG